MKVTRILLVDDDRDVLDLLVYAFAKAGWSTVTADSIAAADALLSEAPPAAAIFDLDVAGESSLDLLPEIRQRLSIPIFILSGDSTAAEADRCRSQGATDFFTKPFSPRALVERLAIELDAADR